MKDNVDLTEGRDFRKVRLSLSGILLKEKKQPLKMEPKDNWEPFSELVLTGNRTQRQSKNIAQSFAESDNCCDCCGDTNPLHFMAGDSLCDRCKARIEYKSPLQFFKSNMLSTP